MNAFPTADATLNRQGMSRWKSGHPWIFRAGLESVLEDNGEEAVARVLDPRGRPLGQALLSRESSITLRRLTGGTDPVHPGFLRDRLDAAIRHRKRLGDRDAVRLVFGESDGLPGLVVDRYGPHLVVQLLSWGMDRLRDPVVEALRDLLDPESILARNDPGARALEGLPRVVEQLHGETPDEVVYHEGNLEFTAHPRTGQKTGAFLDQLDNHLLAGVLGHGRMLDVFTYTGGFALAGAARAETVTAVDTSVEALALARGHARHNGIENVSFVEANAFDYLREQDRQGNTFDTIVLDPPAFAKNKREMDGAIRGYKEINLRAMKILSPGGLIITCSCSYHLSEAAMDQVLADAAADAHRTFRVVERRSQSPDHPVRLGFPESRYLKCQVLEALD